MECQRGRAGIGSYKLKLKYMEARLDKDEIRVPYKIVNPDEIIEYVKSSINSAELKASLNLLNKQPSADDNKHQEENPIADYQTQSPSSTISTSHEDSPRFSDVASPTDAVPESPCIIRDTRELGQFSLAKYVLDNKGVTHVPECNAYIVKGHNDKKYCVTLHPETCQCPSSTRCYHILAVRMNVGLPVDADNREVSLRSLSKRSLKGVTRNREGKSLVLKT